jgi:hypothetical protein
MLGTADGDTMRPTITDQYASGDTQAFVSSLAANVMNPVVDESSLAYPLAKAYGLIRKWLADKFPLGAVAAEAESSAAEYLWSFAECVRTRMHIADIRVGTLAEGWKTFERANDRGKALSGSDLLKSDLFNKAADDADRALVADNWKRMLDELRSAGKGVSPDVFLHHLALADVTSAKIGSREVRDVWRKEVGAGRTAGMLSRELADAAAAYVRIIHGKAPSGMECVPLVDMARTQRLARFRQIRPLLLVGRGLRDDEFLLLATACETFAVVAVTTEERGQAYEGDLFAVTKALRERLASGSSASAVADFLRADFAPILEQRRDAFAAALGSKTHAALGVPFAKYLLFRIEDHLQAIAQTGYQRVRQHDRLQRVHDEHILPQSCPEAASRQFGSTEDVQNWFDRIGNLTLWEGGPNEGHGDAPFDAKVPDYRTSRFLVTRSLVGALQAKGGQQRVADHLSAAQTWNVAACMRRHKEMIAVLFAALGLTMTPEELKAVEAAEVDRTTPADFPTPPRFEHLIPGVRALHDGARTAHDMMGYLAGIGSTGVPQQVLKTLSFFGLAEQHAGRGSSWCLTDLGDILLGDADPEVALAEMILDDPRFIRYAHTNDNAQRLKAAAEQLIDRAQEASLRSSSSSGLLGVSALPDVEYYR